MKASKYAKDTCRCNAKAYGYYTDSCSVYLVNNMYICAVHGQHFMGGVPCCDYAQCTVIMHMYELCSYSQGRVEVECRPCVISKTASMELAQIS
jgi:hypothetical protein